MRYIFYSVCFLLISSCEQQEKRIPDEEFYSYNPQEIDSTTFLGLKFGAPKSYVMKQLDSLLASGKISKLKNGLFSYDMAVEGMKKPVPFAFSLDFNDEKLFYKLFLQGKPDPEDLIHSVRSLTLDMQIAYMKKYRSISREGFALGDFVQSREWSVKGQKIEVSEGIYGCNIRYEFLPITMQMEMVADSLEQERLNQTKSDI